MDDLLLVTSLPKPIQGVCILSYFGILAIFMLYLIEAHVTYHLRILLSKKKNRLLLSWLLKWPVHKWMVFCFLWFLVVFFFLLFGRLDSSSRDSDSRTRKCIPARTLTQTSAQNTLSCEDFCSPLNLQSRPSSPSLAPLSTHPWGHFMYILLFPGVIVSRLWAPHRADTVSLVHWGILSSTETDWINEWGVTWTLVGLWSTSLFFGTRIRSCEKWVVVAMATPD